VQRPLILSERSSSLTTKLFAYYTVHWEHKHTDQVNRNSQHDMYLEINSCLYFQNEDDKDEWEQIRQDGSGYVVTYPSHCRPTEKSQVYNFDRPRNFLLTSDDVYPNSKMIRC
jgi:hypothetical protein